MPKNANTGSEVLAYCGSCKMDLTAVVVAKTGAKIAKVQCKTCKKEHAFKDPKGVTDPGQAPKPSIKRKSASASGDEEVKSVPIESEWKRLMDEAAKTPKIKYSVKATLKLGDVVIHPMFGNGIVMRVLHPDKAEIMFQTSLKLLIHSH